MQMGTLMMGLFPIKFINFILMKDNQKKEKLDFTSVDILSAKSKLANVAFTPKLTETEKDKRAKERLKKYPIPKEFLRNK